MKTNRVGGTCVEVSTLGFGGAPLGNLYAPIDDRTASDAIEAAWRVGVRYFDTAPHYGLGLSELRIGTVLAGRPRDEFTVSTKVGRLLVTNPNPTGADLSSGGFAVPDTLTRQWDFSRDGVRRSLDASLERLGLDRVDIVYVHDPDDYLDVAIHQAIPALVELRDQGVIGAVGAGMNTVDPLRRIVAESDVDVVMVAGRWTLIDRSAEQLLAECAESRVSVVAAAPFNSGLLAHAWPPDDATFDYAPAADAVLATARALARACVNREATLPQAAIQFPLRQPAVASVVAGMSTAQQVAQDAAWAAAALPAGLLDELDALVSR